jgi:uncharacterized protein (TIGR02145 family)
MKITKRSFLSVALATLILTFCSCSSVDDVFNGGSSSSTTLSSSSATICGAVEYNPATEGCCGSAKFTLETHFCDARKNQIYKWKLIDTQVWMAENLNYETSGSVCYEENPANCEIYGKLYNWKTATAACPSGWHLPIKEEWDALIEYAGGLKAATKLKAESDYWNSNGYGTDDYGFAALPGGRGNSDGTFSSEGLSGYWWTSTELSIAPNNANSLGMGYSREDVAASNTSNKNLLYSVRCVKGN